MLTLYVCATLDIFMQLTTGSTCSSKTHTDCFAVFQLQQSLGKEAILSYMLPVLLTQSSQTLASVALSNLMCITSKFYS
jgi:hypothetical protein